MEVRIIDTLGTSSFSRSLNAVKEYVDPLQKSLQTLTANVEGFVCWVKGRFIGSGSEVQGSGPWSWVQ